MNEKKSKRNDSAIIIILIIIGVVSLICILLPIMIWLIMIAILIAIDCMNESYFINIGDYESHLKGFENQLVTSYDEITDINVALSTYELDFDKYDYYVFEIPYNVCSEKDVEPVSFEQNLRRGTITIEIQYTKSCRYCEVNYKYYALRLDKDAYAYLDDDSVIFTYNITNEYLRCEYDYAVDKPMIYIYPEKDMDVEVTLGNSELITTSYPKYNNSWKVFARKDGYLEYEGRTYYGLYWEGKNHKVKVEEDGFVIKGEDTSKFLEEKLEILGLNEREINEFIIYWLPKMEHNKYNYVRFETKEEIDEYMPLEISPKPESVIRVYMNYKALDEKIEVKEQKLEKVERKGYSVIEWGGSVIEDE